MGCSVCSGVWGRASAGEVSPTGRETGTEEQHPGWQWRAEGCLEGSVCLEVRGQCCAGPHRAGRVT